MACQPDRGSAAVRLRPGSIIAVMDADPDEGDARGRRAPLVVSRPPPRSSAPSSIACPCPRARGCSMPAAARAGRSRSSSTTARSAASSSTPRPPRWPAAARWARSQVGRLEELPWEDGTFDLITCLDVIEHVPDDVAALAELRRVCRPGGWLLVTVPAYQALWSRHDEANHHYRRYSRAALRAAARRRRLAAGADELVQQPAAGAGGGGAAGPAASGHPQRLHQRSRSRTGAGSTTCSSARWPSRRAGWRAAERSRRGCPCWRCCDARRPGDGAWGPGGGSDVLALAALISVTSSLGYLLPAIIGLESMGVPSPGETALVLAAVLASQGKLQIWLVILIGVASAIVGDNIGYLLGRRFGREVAGGARAVSPAPAWRSSRAGDRFFANVTGPRRCSSPAGSRSCASPPPGWRASTRCGFGEFFFWNALGGITWGITYGLVGYFAGTAAADAISKFGSTPSAACCPVPRLHVLPSAPPPAGARVGEGDAPDAEAGADEEAEPATSPEAVERREAEPARRPSRASPTAPPSG